MGKAAISHPSAAFLPGQAEQLSAVAETVLSQLVRSGTAGSDARIAPGKEKPWRASAAWSCLSLSLEAAVSVGSLKQSAANSLLRQSCLNKADDERSPVTVLGAEPYSGCYAW